MIIVIIIILTLLTGDDDDHKKDDGNDPPIPITICIIGTFHLLVTMQNNIKNNCYIQSGGKITLRTTLISNLMAK